MQSLLQGETSLQIAGPVGVLEALISLPAAERVSQPLVVVCHPHPLGGGTMNNKVVATLVRHYRDLGLPVLRFNFRGVGHSQGVHDHGRGELDDLRAVIETGLQQWPVGHMILAGFSFGSFVAASVAASDQRCQHLLLVAPPVQNYPFEHLALPAPTWVVQGDADELVSVDDVRRWVKATPSVTRYEELSGCGHFFHGRLQDLSARLHAPMQAWLTALQS
ncbi:MAG: alpha/beta fold hydrolase [Pseudomonadales bacterium]|nr:alpha/beta fold hydrolase [Pseudomonadales bacterium]